MCVEILWNSIFILKKSFFRSLGVILRNEDMLSILQQFRTYLPPSADKGYDLHLFLGDQLTVERAVTVISSVVNGYKPKDRLEGITLQLGN